MCGIAGFAASDPAAPTDERLGRAMAARLAHRGPDGEGVRAMPGCLLAHRRLAVIDLSDRAAQPMANEDASIWVVFNGEIYNYVELRRDLLSRHPFRSDSDTEVLLHLYEERGAEFVRDLRGMFALALWDSRERRLLLARDRIGKKPLHYRIGPEGILFASEIPALLAAGADSSFDPAVLGTYLALGYIPAPRTAIRGIARLEAGSILTWEKGRAQTRRFWSPPIPASRGAEGGPGAPRVPATPEEAAEKIILPALEEAVRIRLRSDVPLGVFLSGGIDSAVVAALAARESSSRLRTFTVVFEESGYDESAAARRTAAHLGTDHHEIRVEARAAEALPSLLRTIGEPLADSSLVAVHRLSQAVRREATVALSGDGGDEIFLGYDRYRAHRLAERWGRVPAIARQAASALASAVPLTRSRRNLAGRLGRFLEAAGRDPFDANDLWVARFEPGSLGEVVTAEAAAHLPADPLARLHEAYAGAGGTSPLDAIARADLMIWLPDDVLRKVDGASMACALEIRSPLLDREVVERAASLPSSIRMPGSRAKAVLKAAARRLLPAECLSRPKAGFGLPVDRWLRGGPLRDLARDVLGSPSARTRPYIRPEVVGALLADHESGAANHDEAIWTLLVLEIFLRDVAGAAP